LIALLVGIGSCVLAAVAPAVGSSRIPPVAALRELALDRARSPRRRILAGMVCGAGGAALVVAGAIANDGSAALAGPGVLLAMVGAILLGPSIARPTASALGALAGRRGGGAALLARRNATRDPRRTARAATALMIGITVVALLTIVA